MKQVIFAVLDLSTQLAEGLSSLKGAKTTSKTMVRQIQKSKDADSLYMNFLNGAKEPNIKWGYKNSKEANNVHFVFRDGELPLTSGDFTYAKDGVINYDFSIVNPKTHIRELSSNGFYDPNKPFFTRKKHGAGYNYDSEAGNTTVFAHSKGFSNTTTVNNARVIQVYDSVKEMISDIASFFRKTPALT